MRVAVVDALVPFAPRDAAALRRAELETRLARAGHETVLVRLPFYATRDPLAQVQGARLLALPGIECVVALRFPACAVRHPRKLVWRVPAEGERAGSGSEALRAAERALLAEAELVVEGDDEAALAQIVEAVERAVDAPARESHDPPPPIEREQPVLDLADRVAAELAELGIDPRLAVVDRVASDIATYWSRPQ